MLEQRRTLESWRKLSWEEAVSEYGPFGLCYFCKKRMEKEEVFVEVRGKTSAGVRVAVHGHMDCAVSMGYIW